MKVLDTSSVRDDQRWPPGFRFHPTDEELVLYYLKRKICRRRLKLDIIGETDVYKWDPEELPGLSKLKTGDRQWFFFSHRDRKYPNGGRSNRATRHGYWKATGKDRQISCNARSVGVKKTLVFYKGRAPTGERTDWVMHEYTLDEAELQRCPMVKDYYALYKVFKKSGPGPKNGEQYGAHFREEDWADDENANAENIAPPEAPLKLVDAIIPPVTSSKAIVQVEMESPSIDDLEEFMNHIADDPVIPPLAVDYDHALHELFGQEENGVIFDCQSLSEANQCAQSVVSSLHNNELQSCFGPTQSTLSHMQNNDRSEVTSDPVSYQQKTLVEEDFFEDFLEMDDLCSPEPECQNIGKPSMNFEDLDGLCEFDLFQDANMFLQNNAEHVPEQLYYSNDQNNEMMVPPMLANNIKHEVQNPVSQSYYGNVGPLDYQMQNNNTNDLNQVMNDQFWMADQDCNNFAADNQFNQQGFAFQSSGVVNDGGGLNQNHNHHHHHDQNQGGGGGEGGDNGGGDSWFSSALWSFVESIPTTPASAAETSAYKAFERVSSFRRLRINVGDAAAAAAAGNSAANKRRSGSSKGIYIVSVVGVVCAALWMLNR